MRKIRIPKGYPARQRKIEGKKYRLVGGREKKSLALRFAEELRKHHKSVRTIKYKKKYWVYVR